MSKKPREELTKVNKGEICAILTMGCNREVAAAYVGCQPDTIRSTALDDEEFALAIERAESQHEVKQVSYINEAAKDVRYWRAAAWALERRYPGRYGVRRPQQFTLEQVMHVLTQFAEIVLEEFPKSAERKRILARLTELAAELEQAARARKKKK